MLEAFVVSVIASLVFTAVMFLIAGIYLFTIPNPTATCWAYVFSFSAIILAACDANFGKNQEPAIPKVYIINHRK